jgi:hypothetical protein
VLIACLLAQFILGYQLRKVYYCQHDFIQFASVVDKERAAVAQEEREASDALWKSLLEPGVLTSVEERQKRILTYIDRREQADLARAQHPLPILEDSC